MFDYTPPQATLLWQLKFEGPWPTAVAFLGSGRKLAAANEAGQVFVWDLPEKPEAPADGDANSDAKPKDAKEKPAPNIAPVRRLDGHDNAVTRLVATADGKALISASLDHTVRIWPVDAPAAGTAEVVLDGESRKTPARRGEPPKPPLGQGGALTVETQTACHVLEGHRDWVQALNLSGDGRRLISGDASSTVIVWDLAERKEISRWTGHPWNWIVAAALSPDGEVALVSEFRYKRDDFDHPCAGLKLWNVADGKEKLDLLKVQYPKLNPLDHSYGAGQVWRKFVSAGLVAAEFSPDGKIVALAQGGENEKGQVHLLDVETGKLLRTVSGHQYGVTDVKFTADGKHLLSTGRDTTLRICQVEDGKEIAHLGTPRGGQFKDWLSAVAISPDQHTLAATDIAGMVHVWSWEK